jgi:predicted small lipoprotein YifL
MRSDTALRIALVTTLAACGEKEPAKAPEAPPVDPPSTEAAPTPEPPPAPVPEPRKRKPFEVYSACDEVVTVVFAQDPKAPHAGSRTIAPGSTIEGPRDNEGNQTVWLLDEKGEPLIKVHVTRGMKRVEIGKSCRTLDAR